MAVTTAVILAGGLGTRLETSAPGKAKCMAEVRGIPFIFYLLEHLHYSGMHQVILSVGFRKEQIVNTLGNTYKNLKIRYSVEDEPLGTGGAIKLAFSQITDNQAFVLNGDTYFPVSLIEMETAAQISGAKASIALKKVHDASRYGTVRLSSAGFVESFVEKNAQQASALINGGIYLMNKDLVSEFPQPKFSVEKDFFAQECNRIHIKGYISDADFIDIGTPADYIRSQIELPEIQVNTI